VEGTCEFLWEISLQKSGVPLLQIDHPQTNRNLV